MAEIMVYTQVHNLTAEDNAKLAEFLVKLGAKNLTKPKVTKEKEEPASVEISYSEKEDSSNEPPEFDPDLDLPDNEPEIDEEPAEEKPKKKAKAADPVKDGSDVIKAFKAYFAKHGAKKSKEVLSALKLAKISEVKPEQYAKALKLLK